MPSILARLRTMPASCISASFLAAFQRTMLSGSNPSKARAEVPALAQDGDPRQAGLEPVEDELLEQRPVVIFGRAPLLVVIGDVERVGARPRATQEPVGAAHGLDVSLGLLPLGHAFLFEIRPRPHRAARGGKQYQISNSPAPARIGAASGLWTRSSSLAK